MDIIELTRELGKAIQNDERYTKYNIAKQASDLDETLQNLIGDFNLKRMEINTEAQKEDRSEEKMQSLNMELRTIYGNIMANERMLAYNEAKEAVDTLLQRVSAIITKSAEGEDPETADVDPVSCSGSCSTCGGCH